LFSSFLDFPLCHTSRRGQKSDVFHAPIRGLVTSSLTSV
jgi:hypothetical protein